MTSPAPASAPGDAPVAGAVRRAARRARGADPGLLLVVAASLLLGTAYAIWAWQRHRWYLTSGYDLGIFDEAAWHLAHLRAPASSLREIDDLWGDHFHPIIVLWGLARAAWPSPVALLTTQALVLATAMIPLYLFARPRIGPVAASLVALAFGTSWGVQRAIDFDVHEVAFGPVLLFAAVLAADRRRWGWYWAATVALLCVKEDVSLLVVAVGVWLLLDGRRRVGGATVVLGLAWFAAATRWWIPHFAGGQEFSYWSYHRFGDGLFDALGYLALHPWTLLTVAVDPSIKVETLALLCAASLLVLPWLSRLAVVPIPVLAERFLSDQEVYWGNAYHYSVLSAAALAVAAVGGLQTVDGWWRRRRSQAGAPGARASAGGDGAWPDAPPGRSPRPAAGDGTPRAIAGRALRAAGPAGVLAALGLIAGTASWFLVFGSHGNLGQAPLAAMARTQPPPRIVDRHLLDRVVAAVPRTGSVAAVEPLQPHLTGRGQAIHLLYARTPDAPVHTATDDNVVLDLSSTDAFSTPPAQLPQVMAAIEDRLRSGDLVPVAAFPQGWVVLRSPRAPGGAVRPAAEAPLPQTAAARLQAAFDRWAARTAALGDACPRARCGAAAAAGLRTATRLLRDAFVAAAATASPGCRALLRDGVATTAETVGRLVAHGADPADARARLGLGAALQARMLGGARRALLACAPQRAAPAPTPELPPPS